MLLKSLSSPPSPPPGFGVSNHLVLFPKVNCCISFFSIVLFIVEFRTKHMQFLSLQFLHPPITDFCVAMHSFNTAKQPS